MSHKHILATIRLAHHFGSAFTPEQVYRYLRVEMDEGEFSNRLQELLDAGRVRRQDGVLFTAEVEEAFRQKQQWSRELFGKYRRILGAICRAPWVRFVALTGANAFESCRKVDDLDLFIITQKNRLWLCYLLLVLISKLLGKRGVLCLNYLVDEAHLAIEQEDYFTAVQLMQMIPLTANGYYRQVMEANPWVFRVLPNARPVTELNPRYVLGNSSVRRVPDVGKLSSRLDRLNRWIYRRYARRLQRKFPREFGRGIVVREGLAKLNRVDHQDIYEQIYHRIYRELEERFPA